MAANSRTINVWFDDVGTLAVGDKVTVSGVRRGKVKGLELTERGVEVELLVHQDVILRTDARIEIKNLGLMGERFVAIHPGYDQAVLDSTTIVAGEYDSGLPEVMGLMGEMIVELRSLVGSFRQTIGSDSTLEQFNRTVHNLESASAGMAGYMDRNQGKLDQTATNFLNASKKLNSILQKNSDRVDSTLQRVDRVSVLLEQFVIRLDSLSQTAREFAETVTNSDGTLQALLEDRRLYDDLRKTADNIDDLIADVRANPRKYINLTVELF